MDLKSYESQRDAILQKIANVLEADQRVRAAWLSGSFGRGEQDSWSDLDLHVAVADAAFSEFLEERPTLYKRIGVPLLIQSDMTSDSQPGARFQLVIYPGPVEVDWNVGPESQAVLPLNYMMLIERSRVPISIVPSLTVQDRRAQADHWLTFFWAMAPIGIKLCARGDTRRAMHLLDLHTSAYIVLWRLTSSSDGGLVPHSANPVLEPALRATLPAIGPTITPETALAAMRTLRSRVQELHPALESLGASVPNAMIRSVANFDDLAAQVVHCGPVLPPPFR